MKSTARHPLDCQLENPRKITRANESSETLQPQPVIGGHVKSRNVESSLKVSQKRKCRMTTISCNPASAYMNQRTRSMVCPSTRLHTHDYSSVSHREKAGGNIFEHQKLLLGDVQEQGFSLGRGEHPSDGRQLCVHSVGLIPLNCSFMDGYHWKPYAMHAISI